MVGTAGADELSAVIGGLYEAALDASLWAGMAPRLAAALRSSSAVLKTYDAGGQLDLLETTDNLKVTRRDEALADYWHHNDLWVERSAAYGAGRVVIGHQVTPFAELEETGYYRDWLRRLAIHDMVGGVVTVAGGGLGVLGIHRDRDEATFEEAHRDAVATLLPHLERALRIRERLAPVAALAALTALERTGLAVLVVAGARRAVVFANAAAERLLSETPELSALNGRLRAPDPLVDTRVALAVARALMTAGGAAAAPRPACRSPAPAAARWS